MKIVLIPSVIYSQIKKKGPIEQLFDMDIKILLSETEIGALSGLNKKFYDNVILKPLLNDNAFKAKHNRSSIIPEMVRYFDNYSKRFTYEDNMFGGEELGDDIKESISIKETKEYLILIIDRDLTDALFKEERMEDIQKAFYSVLLKYIDNNATDFKLDRSIILDSFTAYQFGK
jgi:hypothetical protein